MPDFSSVNRWNTEPDVLGENFTVRDQRDTISWYHLSSIFRETYPQSSRFLGFLISSNVLTSFNFLATKIIWSITNNVGSHMLSYWMYGVYKRPQNYIYNTVLCDKDASDQEELGIHKFSKRQKNPLDGWKEHVAYSKNYAERNLSSLIDFVFFISPGEKFSGRKFDEPRFHETRNRPFALFRIDLYQYFHTVWKRRGLPAERCRRSPFCDR